MRIASMVIGIILVIFGIWVLVGHPSYEDTDTAAKVGPISVQATHDRAIPQWAGIAGVVVGGVLLIGGFATKRRP